MNIGDKLLIIEMVGEPHYSGRTGIITKIDDAGAIHGTWGGCSLDPNIDTFEILEEE